MELVAVNETIFHVLRYVPSLITPEARPEHRSLLQKKNSCRSVVVNF